MKQIRTVLAVDDDDCVLRSYARSCGAIEILAASDVATALELAAARRPDLAIVDLNFGGETRVGLVGELKRASPETIIVVASGFASIAATVQAMRDGAHDVICKPATLAEILSRATSVRPPVRKLPTPSLARAQWEHVHRVLADCDGNVSMTARELGVYRTTLRRWLRKPAPKV